MYCNLSKQKIIEKFESLEMRSNEFQINKKENEVLVIAIISVGRAFSPETNETQKEKAKLKNVNVDIPIAEDGS